jgi:hypothetical protein
VTKRVEPFPTKIEERMRGVGRMGGDNELVGAVWKEAPESTTQSVGGGGAEDIGCEKRATRCAPIEPLEGGGDNKVSIVREAIIALGKTSGPGAW